MAYSSLIENGLIVLSIQAVKEITVDSFRNNERRDRLFKTFEEKILKPLESSGIPCNIYLDGSFLTKKEEPTDIDLAIECDIVSFLKVNPDFINQFRLETQQSFRKEYLLDVYIFNIKDEKMFEYWASWFTHDRDSNEKGCAVIRINGGAR